jgi:hypothetical protein
MKCYAALFFLIIGLMGCEKESNEMAEIEKMVLLEDEGVDHGSEWSVSESQMISQESPFRGEEVVEEVR